jgi:hypothetical protein
VDISPSVSSDPLSARILDRLPAAVFVLDSMGTISFATDRAARLVGRRPEDLVGESVLEFVSAETAWAYAAAVAMATDYAATIMGPMRVSFDSGDGETLHADLWATNHLDDPELAGIVCMLTEATTAMGLGDAIAGVATEEPVETIAARVAVALRSHPVVGDAAVFVERDGRAVPLRPTAVPDTLLLDDPTTPWAEAIRNGGRQLYPSVEELPEALRHAASEQGYGALWVEPVGSSDDRAALAIWRPHVGNPSPNELKSVFQAASILGLARRLQA